MFKKGQLVKNRSRRYYIVAEDQEPSGPVYVVSLIGFWSVVPEKHLELIGNNYQAKPKCSR